MRLTITISRQMGSLGYEIARLAADALGFRLVWRELINQAALRAGAPELALAAIDELGLLGICPSPADCQAYRQAVRQVVEELAQVGDVVIIGRAGQAILAGRPDVLHVRIVAPFEIRAQRIAQRNQISLDHAKAQVEASDHFRASYLKRFYQTAWADPNLYDLVINTAQLTPELVSSLILTCARSRMSHAQSAMPAAQEIHFEPDR